MTRPAAVGLAVLVLVAAVSGQGLQAPQFVPPRLRTAELPPVPSPNVTGGGEVMIEALVDRTGTLLHPSIVRTTPPYTQFVLEAIARWRFDPAREIDYKGLERTVDMPVIVAAMFRPAILTNAPTIGESPRDWTRPSSDVAFPIATAMPNFPVNAREGGVILYELKLNEAGGVTDARQILSNPGLDSVSREALAGWRFKGGVFRARPVPTTAYVMFAFRSPTGLEPLPPTPTPSDPYKPDYKPVPNPEPYKPGFTPAPNPEPYKPDSKPNPYKPDANPDPYKPDFKPPPPKSGAAVMPSFGVSSSR